MRTWALRPRRLYFITPSIGACVGPGDIVPIVEEAIRGGAGIVQWRQKPKMQDLAALAEPWASARDGARDFLLPIAQRVRELTRQHGVPLIVNDSIELALQLEADGVHVGQADTNLAEVQRQTRARGRDFIIGVTVRDGEQARAACEGGATYLGAGPVYTSSTKPEANDGNAIGINGLKDVTAVAAQYDVPVFAIGGLSLTDDRIQHCIRDGGAAGVAVIAAISDAADKSAAASEILKAIDVIPRI